MVCVAATIFLARDLRDVIIPLIWAAFFALPIVGSINATEKCLVAIYSGCRRCWRRHREAGWRPPDDEELEVPFVAVTGQGFITVRRDWKTDEMLRRINRPLGLSWRCCRKSKSARIAGCCRRRVRVVDLSADLGQEDGEDSTSDSSCGLGPEVNRLVEGWHYYVRDAPLADSDISSTTADSSGTADPEHLGVPSCVSNHVAPDLRRPQPIDLELFLDHSELYPSVVDAGLARRMQLKGRLQVERPSTVSWSLALLIVGCLLVLAVGGFAMLLGIGITSLVDNVEAYQKGINEFGEWILRSLKRVLPENTVKEFEDKLGSFVKDAIPAAVKLLMSNVEIVLWDFVLFVIYLGFWISEPLPIDKEVARVFRVYLFLKTLVCILFGSLMGMLLWCLDCPLWPLFWVMTFLMNYIPEVGALLSALLSVPAVLFNGEVSVTTRCWRTVWLCLFGTLLKVITGNIIEVHVYSTKGGQFMRMHPVILMTMMMLCYSLMGVSGMFLAVPVVATLKFYIVATNMPRAFLHPLLILIEGDVTSPHKNFVDTHKAQGESEVHPRVMVTDVNTDSLQLRLLDQA